MAISTPTSLAGTTANSLTNLTTGSFTVPIGNAVIVVGKAETQAFIGSMTLQITHTLGGGNTFVTCAQIGTHVSGNSTVAGIWLLTNALGVNGSSGLQNPFGTVSLLPSQTTGTSQSMTLDVYTVTGCYGFNRIATSGPSTGALAFGSTPATDSLIMAIIEQEQIATATQSTPSGYTSLFSNRQTNSVGWDSTAYKNGSASSSLTFGGTYTGAPTADVAVEFTTGNFVADSDARLASDSLLPTITTGISATPAFDSGAVTETTLIVPNLVAIASNDAGNVNETVSFGNQTVLGSDSGVATERTSLIALTPADVIEFRAYNSALTSYVLLPDSTGGQLQDTYSDVGYGSVSYPQSGLNFSALQPLGVVGVAVNGIERLRFIIEDIQGDDLSEQGNVKTFSGRSVFAYLERAIVYPSAWPSRVPSNTAFTLQTPGTIFRTLVQAAQTRGTLPSLDVSTFTGTTDSNGTAWPQKYSVSLSAGTNYLQVLQNMVQSGQCEARMVGLSLRLYVPATGVFWPDSTIIQQGKTLTEASSHQTTTSLGTVQLAGGDNGTFQEVVGSTAGTLGRYERFTTFSGVTDAGNVNGGGGTLGVLANATVAQTDYIPNELTVGYSLVQGPKPYAAYQLGDWIWYEVTGTPVQYRVRQITLSTDQNGDITLGVTLSDLITETAIQLQRKVQNILGGATGSISQPVTEGPDDVAPSAPTGAAFSSSAYTDLVSGQTFAEIALTWTPPTLNADGSALTDLAGYLAEWHYVGDGSTSANMLTAVDSSFETGVGSWVSSTSGLATTIAQSFAGSHSLQVTSAGGGLSQAITGQYSVPDASRFYQAWGEIRTITARQCNAELIFYDVSHNVIARMAGSTSASVANNWVNFNVNVQCPAGAKFVALAINVYGTTSSEVYYLDYCGLLEDKWNPMGFVSDLYNYTSVSPVSTGKLVECRVAAVDQSNNVSTWDTTTQAFTASDATPPGQPSTPVVTSVIAGLSVVWSGFDTQGHIMPPDFDHLAIYFNTANTTVGATLWDSIRSPSGGSSTITNLIYGTNYYVFFVAYDISGNASLASAIVGPNQIDHVSGAVGGDITSFAADIITGGTIKATFIQLGGRLTTAALGVESGSRVEFDASGIRAYNSTSTGESSGQILNFDSSGNGVITGATIQTAPTNSSGVPFWQLTNTTNSGGTPIAIINGFVGSAGETAGSMQVFNYLGLVPIMQFTSPSLSGQPPATMSLVSSSPFSAKPPSLQLGTTTGINAIAMAPTSSTMVSQPVSNTTGTNVNFGTPQWPVFTFIAPPSGRVCIYMFLQASNTNTNTSSVLITCSLSGTDGTFVNATTANNEQPASSFGAKWRSDNNTLTPQTALTYCTSIWFIGFQGVGTQPVNVAGGGTQVGLTPGILYTVQPIWQMSSGTWWTTGLTDTSNMNMANITIVPQM